MSTGIFSAVGNSFESAISGIASATSSNVISLISPVVAAGVTLYFVISGYLYMAGRRPDSLPDWMVKAVKIWLVALVGLNTGNFTTYAIEGINGLESDFSGAIGKTASFTALDEIWTSGMTAAGSMIKSVGDVSFNIGNISGALATALILIFAAAVTAIALSILCSVACGVMLLAKCALVIILGFGPLFICALMFPVTRHWFDGWLKSALSQVFTVVIAYAIINIFLTVLNSCSSTLLSIISAVNARSEGATQNAFEAAITIGVACLVTVYIVAHIPAIAIGLVGGVSIAAISLTAMASGAITGAAASYTGAAARSKEIGEATRTYAGYVNALSGGTLGKLGRRARQAVSRANV